MVRSSEIRKSLEPFLLRIELVWPCNENALGETPQTIITVLAKANGRIPVERPKLDETITLRILNGIALDFTHAK